MPTLHDNSTISTTCMEHQILAHIKQALRVTLDWQAPEVSLPRKLSSIQFTMKSFQRHLERVMSIEEEGGYMNEVLEVKPNLQTRVESLAGDHARFRAQIRTILPALNGLNDWDEPRFHQVCDDLRALLDAVDRHNELETELLQESLMMDEGGEG